MQALLPCTCKLSHVLSMLNVHVKAALSLSLHLPLLHRLAACSWGHHVIQCCFNVALLCLGRIRPPGATGDLSPSCIYVGVEGDLAVYDPVKGDKKVFKVDRIFDSSSAQCVVYEDTQPLIRSVLDGKVLQS